MPSRDRTIRMTVEQARAAASTTPPLPAFTDEEIERRAADDPDAPLSTDAELAEAVREYAPGAPRRRPKQLLSLRIDADVVDAYRATGPGWQRRMHEILAAGAPGVTGAARVVSGQSSFEALQFQSLHERVLRIEQQIGGEKAHAGRQRPHTVRVADWSVVSGEKSRGGSKGGGRVVGSKPGGQVAAKHRAKSPGGVLSPGKAPRKP